MHRLNNLSLSVSNIASLPSHDLFGHVEMAPPDPVLGTRDAFNKDTNANKVNLGVGAYRDGEGKPYVFKVIDKIEKDLITKTMNHVDFCLFRSILRSRDMRLLSMVLEV